MLAVIKISGKQYAVAPNTDIDVDKILGEEGDVIEITDVLLRDTGKKVEIGEPVITGAKVKATIVKQFQGEKIHVRRYKSKVRYRKATGFRAQLTKLHIEDIQ